MKNSASIHPTIQALQKQALQKQAWQILPILTAIFLDLKYNKVSHQRIGKQGADDELNYQGLSRAGHKQLGEVIIKWQLTTVNGHQKSADLNHEAGILTSLNTLSTHQHNFTSIAPPKLAYDSLRVEILAQSLQLTLLVMPYYSKGSLAAYIRGRNHASLSAQKKHDCILQSALLIANLHSAGWLHNDIKPSNILLDGILPNQANSSGAILNVLLTDFALAQPIDDLSTAHPSGTPAYLAPERWQGRGATVQSDIYAFGIMMYEILMDERPFNIMRQSKEPFKAWALLHCQQPVAKLPPEYSCYQSIIDKALAKQVASRYPSMNEIILDLNSLESE